jgi:hypothetical protein
MTMPDEPKRPWDARLVDWMGRGSSEARGPAKRQWTPKKRIAYCVFWTAYLSILVGTSRHNKWWAFPLIVLFVVGSQFAVYLWERHRRRTAEATSRSR